MIGTAFSDDVMATGFGSYLALPIMRKRWHENMTEGEARALLEDCMRVLFYRYVVILFIYLFIYLFFHLFIYLFIYLFDLFD